MDAHRRSVAVIGEALVELSPTGPEGLYRLGVAGDTFNTAVSLARLDVTTAYVTRLGDDPFSDRILGLMNAEGIDPGMVERVPHRQPGLYLIETAADGERRFRYWRTESPARDLWSGADCNEKLEAALANCSCIYLSGITLAIMKPEARERMKRFLSDHRRRGGRVAFDSNYRPRLWDSAEEARATIAEFLQVSDLALLTMEDEQALWGDRFAASLVERHRQCGIGELVIKRGGDPVILWDGHDVSEISVPPVEGIVDTTGAGDAFNAGYLAEYMRDGNRHRAVVKGNRAASAVIRQRGGIVEKRYFMREMSVSAD